MPSWTKTRQRTEQILSAVNGAADKVLCARTTIYCDDVGMDPVPAGEELTVLYKKDPTGFCDSIFNIGAQRMLLLQMRWFPPNFRN